MRLQSPYALLVDNVHNSNCQAAYGQYTDDGDRPAVRRMRIGVRRYQLDLLAASHEVLRSLRANDMVVSC